MDILNVEYDLNTKEVVSFLNKEYGDLFNKQLDSKNINYWVNNYEINAIKNDKNRWLFRKVDILDFVYRYKNNLLNQFNSSYFDRTRIKVSTNVLYEIFKECETVFQKIVCILTTLHPYALFNDPERKYRDLGRHEGGIVFKDAAIHFGINSVSPKDTVISLRKQRLLYPVIVTEVIESLITEYTKITGEHPKERLITAGWKLINNNVSLDEYTNELNSLIFFGGWRGLVHNYEAIPGNEMIWPIKLKKEDL